MTSLDALTLAYLPMEDPGFSADPLPHFAAVRERASPGSHCAFGHVVTSTKRCATCCGSITA